MGGFHWTCEFGTRSYRRRLKYYPGNTPPCAKDLLYQFDYHKRGNTDDVLPIPLVALRTHRESLTATQFNSLIKPGFQGAISQDREIIIGHFHFFLRTIQ